MNREQWSRLRELFAEAEKLPPSERPTFLHRESAGDAELRAELERILAASDSASEFLVASDTSPRHGSVGPYRLVEIIGEGGFGVVYLAEQRQPIRRRVALKLIKPGMDTKQVIARFEAERQALALMDHPGIAQVYDAGATESGHPYFAMEYVPGSPITTFCDRERLGIAERLRLFLQVCDAIQHAHQKGVIHRDIKPSNVVVTLRDGLPSPKVIDFGIVKATTPADAAASETLLTREGLIIGTLGYMSPEQATAASKVDTRSDIYSLGMLLYELLVGSPPFDGERLRQIALSDAVRVIREEDPPALETRLARGDEQETNRLANLRSTDPRRLLRDLRGELQWITFRAIDKEPDRRYGSAAELAADIRHHLANEPVLAGAPSTMYRLTKYARRHRGGVVAAALVVAALIVGGIATGIGFRRAVRAEHTALREAESARQVSDFLVALFHASSPGRSKGEVVTARSLLDEGTRRIENKLREDPLVRARVLDAMGSSYLDLGHYDEGIRLKREALNAAESAGPGQEVEIARRLSSLAQALSMAARNDSVGVLVDRAIALLHEADDTDVGALAECYFRKGQWLNAKGESAAAESLVTLALQMEESNPKPDRSQAMRMHASIANIFHRRFDLKSAERHYLRELALSQEIDEPTWSVHAHRRLVSVYRSLGDADKAVAHADEGVRLARKLYAPDHPNLAEALGGQAEAFVARSRLQDAITVREEALGIVRASGTPDAIAYELNALADLYRETRQIDLAVARAEEACEVRRKSGDESPRVPEALATLARCYVSAGMVQRADSTFQAALRGFEQRGSESIFSLKATLDYAKLCRDTGRIDRADTFYLRVEASLDSTNGATRTYLARCRIGHGYLRALQGRHEEAESMFRSGFATITSESSVDSLVIADSHVLWAAARARAGNAIGAVEELIHAAEYGTTAADVARYSELASLRSRPDYPFVNSP